MIFSIWHNNTTARTVRSQLNNHYSTGGDVVDGVESALLPAYTSTCFDILSFRSELFRISIYNYDICTVVIFVWMQPCSKLFCSNCWFEFEMVVDRNGLRQSRMIDETRLVAQDIFRHNQLVCFPQVSATSFRSDAIPNHVMETLKTNWMIYENYQN